MEVIKDLIGFEWDAHNKDKNFIKHRVTDEECEEVFFDERKKMLNDVPHLVSEKRYIVIGQTKALRTLFVVFTLRHKKIRVISVRNLNKKEQTLYEEKN